MLSWEGGDWLLRSMAEARRTRTKNPLPRLLNDYTIEDYGVRPKEDHVESYNKITGEGLFEALTEDEAWADLREEFGA